MIIALTVWSKLKSYQRRILKEQKAYTQEGTERHGMLT